MCEDDVITLSRLPVNIYDDEKSAYHNAVGCFKRMEEEGLITIEDERHITINNFEKRQNSNLSDAERAKRYREKHNVTTVTQKSDDSNARVDKIRKDKIRKDIYKHSSTTSKAIASRDSEFSQLGAEVVKAFEGINHSAKRWYNNRTQRSACDRLIEAHGLERVKEVIAILPQTNSMQYVPTITTPLQLDDKWSSLEAALRRKQQEGGNNVVTI